jgi:uncharacterized secreted protein with C-terminal beta-propeller domain
VVLVAVCVGCPRPKPRNFAFTSADLQGGGRWTNFLAGAAEDTAAGGDNSVVPAREIVEPDVIRRDGDLLYVLNQYRGLSIVDLSTEEVVGQVPTFGYPRDLYLVDDRAYVLVAYAAGFEVKNDTIYYDIESRLYVVDVAQPDDAEILGTFELEGDLVESRLVGDILYAVGADYEWYWDVAVAVKAETSASWVTSVNIADPDNIFQADQISFSGIGSVIHVTNEAIYVAASSWQSNSTKITCIEISDPDGLMYLRDDVTISGQVADKFKLDVWNEVLRVVSHAWSDQSRIYVTTVNVANPNNLSVLAELEFDRARGDSLFATRFDGPRAYVVTYFIVDPLFVVDLSDPSNPSIEGELEVPGWSTYIEPMGDRLLTLGVDDTNGRRVSMSLFNVADPANPTLIDRVSFGQNWSWSSAYGDVKAMTVLDDLVIVPFSGWEDDFGGFERLQFVSYDANDLTKKGVVDVQGTVLRSFEYSDLYYAVTSEQLAKIDASDLNAPQVVDSIVLAENVADFVELSAGLGVELVTRYDTGVTTVRRRDLPLKNTAGEVEVAIGELVNAFKYGSSVVAVGATWDSQPKYKVAMIDFSNPNAPEVDALLDVNVSPYYGYWWWGPYMPYVERGGVAVDSLIAPWYPIQQQGSAFLIGDRLVLRCSANTFDDVIGSEAPYEGLAIVDLTQPAWTTTVGLGFEQVVSVHGGASDVYIASKEALNSINPFRDPLCAYFVTAYNPATGSNGPTVNVPGIFVQYDPSTQVLALRDDQWTANYDYSSTLNTVLWTGGATVTELDDLTLPGGTANVLGRGSKIFMDGYNNGALLYAATVAPNGNLTLGQSTFVTDGWASLVDAKGTSAYLSVGGGAVARYDCTAKPVFEELVQVMGTPAKIHFGSNAAYAPLGYFGIVSLGL